MVEIDESKLSAHTRTLVCKTTYEICKEFMKLERAMMALPEKNACEFSFQSKESWVRADDYERREQQMKEVFEMAYDELREAIYQYRKNEPGLVFMNAVTIVFKDKVSKELGWDKEQKEEKEK